jgi:hypothetical protein
MISLNRFIKYYFFLGLILFLVIGFIISFWGYHASLTEILFIELIIIGVVCIATLSLWFILRKIFPSLHDSQKKQPIALNQPENLSKELNIEYELDVSDVLAYSLYFHEGSPRKRHARKIIQRVLITGICLTLCGAIICAFVFEGPYLYAAEALVALAFLAFVWLIISPYFIKKIIKNAVLKKYSQGQNRLNGKHNFTITPDAITDSSDTGDSKTYWSAIERVESTDQYVFILPRGSGPYIIPRKAFSDDISFKQFIDLANIYHQRAIGEK